MPHARMLTAVAATAVILSAVYLLWTVQRVFFGELKNEKNKTLVDLTIRERCAILPLLGLMIWMGVYPEFILARVRPTLDILRTFVMVKSRQIEMSRPIPSPEPHERPAPTDLHQSQSVQHTA